MHCVGSLSNIKICGLTPSTFGVGGEAADAGRYTFEGISALCEAFKSTTTLTSLKYASQLECIPTVNSL